MGVAAYLPAVPALTTALTHPWHHRRKAYTMTVRTHTRTHVTIGFANPYLRCDTCRQPVPAWHDNTKCGCNDSFWNEPCKHKAGATSVCPSWSPVDGCTCAAVLGAVGHDEEGRCPAGLVPAGSDPVARCLFPAGHEVPHLAADGSRWPAP
jgi:hypothetical protein